MLWHLSCLNEDIVLLELSYIIEDFSYTNFYNVVYLSAFFLEAINFQVDPCYEVLLYLMIGNISSYTHPYAGTPILILLPYVCYTGIKIMTSFYTLRIGYANPFTRCCIISYLTIQ